MSIHLPSLICAKAKIPGFWTIPVLGHPYKFWGRGEILEALTSDACGAECSLSALQATSVYRSRSGGEGKPLAIWPGNAQFMKIPSVWKILKRSKEQLCAYIESSLQVKASCEDWPSEPCLMYLDFPLKKTSDDPKRMRQGGSLLGWGRHWGSQNTPEHC